MANFTVEFLFSIFYPDLKRTKKGIILDAQEKSRHWKILNLFEWNSKTLILWISDTSPSPSPESLVNSIPTKRFENGILHFQSLCNCLSAQQDWKLGLAFLLNRHMIVRRWEQKLLKSLQVILKQNEWNRMWNWPFYPFHNVSVRFMIKSG